MKLEAFFNKFDELADTPNAAPRMRRFIVDLAVRGALVAQDASDEPADELLKRVQSEKARLMKSGEIKKQERLPPIADDAIEFALPPGWALSQLGDVAVCLDYMREPINGTERDLRIAGKAESNLFPYYGATQQQGWVDDFIFDAELVLLGEDGVPFFDDLRPKAYLISGKTWVNNHAHVFQGILVSNAFVTHWLNTFDYTGRVAGSTRSKLNQAKAVDIPIALPPLAEQKRIVAKVNELMALCDRLEAQQQERETRDAALARASLARFADAPTPSNLDLLFHKSYNIPPADLRKSILTLAVQGKLGTQDPNDESAESSLPMLAQVAVEAQDDLFPRHWLHVPLGDFGAWRGGGTPSKSQPAFWNGDMPWVSPKEMKTLRINDAQDHISQGAIEGSSVRLIPTGSILMVVRGMILARAFPVALTGREVTINQDMKGLIPSDSRVAEFLLLALRALEPDVLATIERSSHGTCKLKTDVLEAFQIPVPPLAEQRRIVAKVDELMALVDALETQLATARTAGAALLEAALHELRNPTAEIISFPSSGREALPDRAAIGCYAIQRLADQRTFGRTAEVKVLYLAEAHLGLDLGGRYLREAAGPLDQWIYKFEEDAARLQWFSVVEGQTKDGHKKVEYRAGSKLSAKAQEASTRLSAAQRSKFDRLLELLAQKPTVEVEIIATLFAAWNDFLIDGREPSDDEIVREVRENWHPSKQRFKEPELKHWLAWLRQHALVPQGRGPHTVGQQGKLQLH